ncbi:hypothetical protein MBLNU230_g4063t1 [Neophaeotheca triangularis]
MQPPTNQSPHRFLKPTQKRAPSPKKASKPQASNLREEVHERVDEDLRAKKDVTSSQFARTPRFVASRLQLATQQPSKAAPAQGFRQSGKQREDVQEVHSYDDGEEMLLNGDEDSATIDASESRPTKPRDQTLPHSPKRRRLDASDFPETAARTPQRAAVFKDSMAKSTPRFKLADAIRTSPAPSTAFASRPAFLRPPAPATQQTPSEPLPEAFSPHRRGQKFVPGGLAATLQQWVVETGQGAAQNRRGQGYLRGEEFVLKVRVEWVGGGSVVRFVRGLDGEGKGVRLWLPALERSGEVLERGVVVGVRAPVWEVKVEGGDWVVGADWRVLG